MNNLINLGGIDLLIGADLFYEMLRLDRTHPGNYPVIKRQFLAGKSHVELQPLLHTMTLSIHFCSEKTIVWSTI